MTQRETLIRSMAAALRKAIESGNEKATVATYKALWPYFGQPSAQGVLKAYYKDWTGRAVDTDLREEMILSSDHLLPWHVALMSGPPWPTDLPPMVIPVSIVQVAYLALMPPSLKKAAHAEVVQQWEREHLPPAAKALVKWLETDGKAQGWELIEVRSGAAAWRKPKAQQNTEQGNLI